MSTISTKPKNKPIKVVTKKEKDQREKEKEKKEKEKKEKEKKEKEKEEKEKANKSDKGVKTSEDGPGEDKPELDEHGNPFPMENKEEGGDPICPGGYKIDYQFDPMNDPINPLFRCIPALKDPNDGAAGKLLAMANNPSAGVENLVTGMPGIGGRRGRKRRRNKTMSGTKRRSRRHGHGHRRHTRRR